MKRLFRPLAVKLGIIDPLTKAQRLAQAQHRTDLFYLAYSRALGYGFTAPQALAYAERYCTGDAVQLFN